MAAKNLIVLRTCRRHLHDVAKSNVQIHLHKLRTLMCDHSCSQYTFPHLLVIVLFLYSIVRLKKKGHKMFIFSLSFKWLHNDGIT